MILNHKDIPILTPSLGVDLETNGVNTWENDILVVSITTEYQTYVYETSKYPESFFINLFKKIKEANCLVIGQNIKFDIGFIFVKYNVMLTNIWDTMLASQVCTNGLPYRYTLGEIVYRDLGVHIMDSDMKRYYQTSFIGMPFGSQISNEQLEYAASDTRYLIDLAKAQFKKVSDLELEKVMKLELKLLPVLVKMEVRGCRINEKEWRKTIKNDWERTRIEFIDNLDDELRTLSQVYPTIYKKYLKQRKRATYIVGDLFGNDTQITTETDGVFNYASSSQILDLFTILNQPLPTIKDGDKIKNSAGEGALKTYITEYPKTPLRKFIELLLKFREYEKLISTYGEQFLSLLDSRGYIHTTYSQCHTKTGRLSSRSPNLQNIPKTSVAKDGYDIRQYFLPDEGEIMLTSDMDGAEIRIAADYSKDEKLMKSLLEDMDLHSDLASKSYSIIFDKRVKIDKSDKTVEVNDLKFKSIDLRDKHKSVLFAKFYKGGTARVYEVLAEYINLFHSEDQLGIAGRISRMIDKELPHLSEYLSKLIEEAQTNKKLRGSKLGRIRFFDENVYGEAANYPIQNTNAEALKIALIKIDNYFEETGFGRLVMNIHDEVVCSVKREHVDEVSEFVKTTMANALGWFFEVIPGKATAKTSEHWEK